MSLLIINKNKDNILFASDTRESKINNNGEFEKVHDNSSKIQVINNQLIFGSGYSQLIDNILEDYKKANIQDTNILFLITQEHIDLFKKKHYEQVKKSNGHILLLIIGEYDKAKHNTQIKAIQDDQNKVWVLGDYITLDTFGIKTNEAKEIIYNNQYNNFNDLCQDVFSQVSFAGIGGNLQIYHLTKDNINLTYQETIKEPVLTHRIFGDRILFTNTGWEPQGDYPGYSVAIDSKGIKTDGRFMLRSQNKYGENNLVSIDGDGLKIYGSGDAGVGIEIFNKANQRTFYLDANGNINMAGAITITSGSGYNTLTDKPTALSDINSSEGGKLTGIQAGATVGATWGSNLINIPDTLKSPSGNGLYLTSTHLGFYQSSSWKTYMDNSGNFYLGGTSGKLQWNAGADTLTINGSIFSNGTISIGSGNSIFKADSNGIYLGNGTFASAPFRVTPSGAVTANNATIQGTIKSSQVLLDWENITQGVIWKNTSNVTQAEIFSDPAGSLNISAKSNILNIVAGTLNLSGCNNITGLTVKFA